MTYEEILENLCDRDSRNPYYLDYFHYEVVVEGETIERLPANICTCDNCFKGRDKLAVELLKYVEEGDTL